MSWADLRNTDAALAAYQPSPSAAAAIFTNYDGASSMATEDDAPSGIEFINDDPSDGMPLLPGMAEHISNNTEPPLKKGMCEMIDESSIYDNMDTASLEQCVARAAAKQQRNVSLDEYIDSGTSPVFGLGLSLQHDPSNPSSVTFGSDSKLDSQSRRRGIDVDEENCPTAEDMEMDARHASSMYSTGEGEGDRDTALSWVGPLPSSFGTATTHFQSNSTPRSWTDVHSSYERQSEHESSNSSMLDINTRFYEVEATLVDGTTTNSGEPEIVYDAEPLPALPFMKKHARGIICSMGIFFIAITAAIVAIMSARDDESIVVNRASIPPYLHDSCVEYIGPIFDEEGCDGCSPTVDIDGNVTVAVVESRGIMFIEGDNLENNTIVLDIGYKYKDASVAVSGVFAVVGTPQDDDWAGSVHVFRNYPAAGWVHYQDIYPEDASEGAQFGRSISIDGDVMAIGSYDYQGSVYVYRRIEDTWVNETKLTPNLPMNKDFGKAVKIKGDRLAVGDRLYGFSPEGALFLYDYDNQEEDWIEAQDVHNDECQGRFAVHFELAGDNDLIIGCPKQDKWSGISFVYHRESKESSYKLQQELVGSTVDQGDRFGQTQQISIDGDMMAISEYAEDGNSYIYVRGELSGDNWTEVSIIPPPDSEESYFGDQLALSGSRVVISGNNNAYLYDLEKCHQDYTPIQALTENTQQTTATSTEPEPAEAAQSVGSITFSSSTTNVNAASDANPQWFDTSHVAYRLHEKLRDDLDKEGNSHDVAGSFCKSRGMELCTYDVYCPNGFGSNPYPGGPPLSDKQTQWAPFNNNGTDSWVQVGIIQSEDGGNADNNFGCCYDYSVWNTNDKQKDVEDTVAEESKKWILCCETDDDDKEDDAKKLSIFV